VEEQVARPGDGDPGHLLGVGGAELGEGCPGVVDATLTGQRFAEHHAGVGPARAAGGEGQALGQAVIEPPQGLTGEQQELLGLARHAGLEPPGGQPQPIETVEVFDGTNQVALE
jgi:hypothetical protein